MEQEVLHETIDRVYRQCDKMDTELIKSAMKRFYFDSKKNKLEASLEQMKDDFILNLDTDDEETQFANQALKTDAPTTEEPKELLAFTCRKLPEIMNEKTKMCKIETTT